MAGLFYTVKMVCKVQFRGIVKSIAFTKKHWRPLIDIQLSYNMNYKINCPPGAVNT